MGILDGIVGKFKGESRTRTDVDGLWDTDLAQLERLQAKGADALAPRPSTFFLYFRGQDAAEAAQGALKGAGLRVELVEPSHGVEEWTVLAEGRNAPLIPDFLRDTVDLCERLAKELKGEYECWEASVVDGEGVGGS